MMRTFFALAAWATFLAIAAPSSYAGGRCNRLSYHTLQSNSGWTQSCYSCHKQQGTSGVQSNLDGLAKAKTDATRSLQATEGGASVSAQYDYSGELTYAPQGATVYGYSQFAQSYPQVDLPLLYNQANRLASQAQTLAASASSDFAALVSQEGANQAQVAAILANGQAASEALRAARGEVQPQWQTLKFEARVSSTGEVEVTTPEGQVVPLAQHAEPDAPDGPPDLAAVIEAKCVQCHSGEKPKGGLDLSARAAWSEEETRERLVKMLKKITHPDPQQRMPLGPDNQPGVPLTVEEQTPFFLEVVR